MSIRNAKPKSPLGSHRRFSCLRQSVGLFAAVNLAFLLGACTDPSGANTSPSPESSTKSGPDNSGPGAQIPKSKDSDSSSASATSSKSDPGSKNSSSQPEADSKGEVDTAKLCPPECDPFNDSCPAGKRCTPTVCRPDSGSAWDTHRCLPIGNKALGEACENAWESSDPAQSCQKGLVCWGTCVALCEGSATAPTCSSPKEHCVRGNDGVLSVCRPTCDPLKNECAQGEVCVPAGDTPKHYVCVAKSSAATEGGHGYACELFNECQAGFICSKQGPVDAAGCEGRHCCTKLCNAWKPETCPGAKEYCRAMENQLPGYEQLGVCVIP